MRRATLGIALACALAVAVVVVRLRSQALKPKASEPDETSSIGDFGIAADEYRIARLAPQVH